MIHTILFPLSPTNPILTLLERDPSQRHCFLRVVVCCRAGLRGSVARTVRLFSFSSLVPFPPIFACFRLSLPSRRSFSTEFLCLTYVLASQDEHILETVWRKT